jgi:hypothetical protein
MKFIVILSSAALSVSVLASPSGGLQRLLERRLPAPLIVNVSGTGFQATALEDGVRFDLLNSGTPIQAAWTRADSDDAFLAIDENHNGRIDNGGELVGGMTGPPNGFAFLNAMDGIGDSKRPNDRTPDAVVDSHDAIFARLILWTDRNHNGVSEEDELESLQHAGFAGFYTGYQGVDWQVNGSRVLYKGVAFKRNAGGVEVSRDVLAVELKCAEVRSAKPDSAVVH